MSKARKGCVGFGRDGIVWHLVQEEGDWYGSAGATSERSGLTRNRTKGCAVKHRLLLKVRMMNTVCPAA